MRAFAIPTGLLQALVFLAAFAVSVFLLVADRGGVTLPCFAPGKQTLSPCEEVKASAKARLGFSPALPGALGAAACVLVATWRMGTRTGGAARSRAGLVLRALLLPALGFAVWLAVEQSRAAVWCPWCLFLGLLFLVAAGLESSAARSPRLPPEIVTVLAQAPIYSLIVLGALRWPTLNRDSLRVGLSELLPEFIDREVLADIAPCGYSDQHSRLENFAAWEAPFARGSSAAPVHIAVFHDPFCALCRQFDNEMQPVLARHRTRLRALSFPLDHVGDSREAALFLHAAALARADDDLVARMAGLFGSIIHDPRRDVSRAALAARLESHGISTAPLLPFIESGAAETSLARSRAIFHAAGGTKTPMVVVNGRVVAENISSLRAACLEKLILGAARGNGEPP